MRKQTQFNEEYKRSAVAKAKASGNVTQTARELGISSKSLYRWIKEYAEPLDVDVSPSGYYAWYAQGDVSPRQQADADLRAQIERVFVESRHTYGSNRVWLALRRQGIRTSRKRVERLMRQRGLRSIRARKRRIGLTKAGQNAYFAPNRLKQDFKSTQNNEKWVTDTTYIPTREGWLYLVSEFANAQFHKRAAEAKICLSMSSTGNCYDNASAESLFATIKLEVIPERLFDSRQQAREALFDYIEVFYNRQRIHSGIDYTCPVNYAA